MLYSRSVFGAFACLLGISLASPQDAWSLRHFKTVVAFGDSYTDESRLNYFMTHHGSAPPVGWVNPMVSARTRKENMAIYSHLWD